MKKILMPIAVVVLGLSTAAPALAQSDSVDVKLSGVKDQIAKQINIDESKVPGSVQVPAKVAADVCGTSAKALNDKKGGGGCTAETTSQALNQAVKDKVKG